MDKALRKNTLAIILYVIGIAALIVTFSYIRPQLETESDTLEAKNEQLNIQLNQLNELEANQESNEMQTEEYNRLTQEIINEYPLEVRPEDVVLYAKEIEDTSDFVIGTVGLSAANLIYATGSAQGTDAAAGTDTAAEATTDTETAADTAGSGSTDELGILEESSVPVPSYQLYAVASSFDFTCSYEDMKTIVERIFGDPDKRTITSVSLSYDRENGQLTGNVNLNLYYLMGTDREYIKPDAGTVKKGKSNIFGTAKKKSEE